MSGYAHIYSKENLDLILGDGKYENFFTRHNIIYIKNYLVFVQIINDKKHQRSLLI